MMKRYPELIEAVLRADGLLTKLFPTDFLDRELVRKVRAADDTALAGADPIHHQAMFELVRGGLFYALDALSDAHAIFQAVHEDEASYWHGMMHRREADFDNARYWFRRAGTLAAFPAMHHAASEHSADMARQLNWDPFLVTNQAEQARHGAPELTAEVSALQRAEFTALLDYCWRKSFQPPRPSAR